MTPFHLVEKNLPILDSTSNYGPKQKGPSQAIVLPPACIPNSMVFFLAIPVILGGTSPDPVPIWHRHHRGGAGADRQINPESKVHK